MDLVVGVFFFALIFVPLGLIVWACVRAYRGRSVWIDGSVQLGSPIEDASGRVLAAVTPTMERFRYRLDSHGPNAIAFEKKYRPMWLLIPIIVFFPLGLLALIYSKTVTMAFSLEAQPGGTTRVTFSGQGPRSLWEEVFVALWGDEAGSPGSSPISTHEE